ncbi:MAG: hypothetical protein Q8L75_05195 [Acidobacteriota bacterium]|nr:hypothetical protein [Acidobacteriota bacterium]
MEIARERFLDDTRTYHLTVGIRSRTTAAHSLLSALTDDERAQVSAAIVRALDEVEQVVRRHLPAPSTPLAP